MCAPSTATPTSTLTVAETKLIPTTTETTAPTAPTAAASTTASTSSSRRLAKTKMSSLSLRYWLAFVVLMLAQVSVAVTASLGADEKSALLAAKVEAGAHISRVPVETMGDKQLLRGQAVIDAVPKEARTAFVLYQLAQALNSSASNFTNNLRPGLNPRFAPLSVFVDLPEVPPPPPFEPVIPIYAEFADDLVYWLTEELHMTQLNLYQLMEGRSMLCTADGVCYTQNSIGTLCCPF